MQAFSNCKKGLLFIGVHMLLIAGTSLVVEEHRPLGAQTSVVATQ